MSWTKYQGAQKHECKYPSYLSILFHGGFWEGARIWTCEECGKRWRPKKLVLTGDYTFIEVGIQAIEKELG